MENPDGSPLGKLGRYAVYGEIAAGGMATVHLGRLTGAAGFTRSVAIKRLHPHLAKDPEFVSMFIDEARLAARVRHPNVIPTLDVVSQDDELFLVMEYVLGESLARVLRTLEERRERMSPGIAAGIIVGVLNGLHAAHEARDEKGRALDIVHRDVSPQNVLVGADGVARVLDFGVAKAAVRLHTTREGELKGKLAYMAPEQFSGGAVTRKIDIYAAGQVFWECLAGRRLYARGATEADVLQRILNERPPRLAPDIPDFPGGLDEVLTVALDKDPARRFSTAKAMASAIEDTVLAASEHEVAEWLQGVAREPLSARARVLASIEANTSTSVTLPTRAESSGKTPEAPTEDDPTRVRSLRVWRLSTLTLAAVLMGGLGTIVLFNRNVPSTSPPAETAKTVPLLVADGAAVTTTETTTTQRPNVPPTASIATPSSSTSALPHGSASAAPPPARTQKPRATKHAPATPVVPSASASSGPPSRPAPRDDIRVNLPDQREL